MRSFLNGRMLIGGVLVAGDAGRWLESVDPATEEVIGRFPAAATSDVNEAVAAAEQAQTDWAARDVKERAKYLHAMASRIRARGDELPQLEVRDTGNTISAMRADVEAAATQLEWYSGLATEMKGDSVPASARHMHFTVREPYGVVARIVPFNHPLMFAVRGLAGPLIAGNTVVIKPPETSSLSASILGEIAAEIMPAGTVNIVTGEGASTGDAIVRHPRVKRISFIGSVQTAMAIQRSAAESGIKSISLELGGKNPFIVYPDANPEEVAEAAVVGMNFAWAGQSCGSTSRLLLHESLYDKVLRLVSERVAELKLGSPLNSSSQMGPMNSRRQLDRVNAMISSGIQEGAKLVIGGGRPPGVQFERGYWVSPTVFGDVLPNMRVAREEIFGPVLSVMRWTDEETAIDLANATEYGLTAAIWTSDIKRALNAARRVQTGTVWVNGVGTHFKGMPYGGYKNSGNGRESCLEELLSYTETKAIHLFL